MLHVDRLIELLAVAKTGSIAAAAEHVGTTRSTLSRRLSTLEDEIGTKLLHRGPRSIRLTLAGEILVERARTISAEAEEAWEAVRQLTAAAAGPLRVSTPPAGVFQELLVGFAAHHPKVHLWVVASHRHVDLHEEKIDVAIRFGTIDNESLVARHLVTTRSSLVASPAYLNAMGQPREAADLAAHRCVVNYGQSGLPRPAWPLWAGGRVAIEPHFACQGIVVGLHAAAAGVGIALLPERLTAPYRAKNLLVPVLREEVGMDLVGRLVYTDRRHQLPVVRAFIDYAIDFVHVHDALLPLPILAGDD
ncbi:MAG: LysR family transcriptional regulator [Myxococcota bacterium]